MAIAGYAGLTLHPLVAMVPATLLVRSCCSGTDKFLYKPFRSSGHHQSRDGELWYDALIIRSAVQVIWGQTSSFVGLQNRTLC
jgi:branched-chain amino acid transport system permease protein